MALFTTRTSQVVLGCVGVAIAGLFANARLRSEGTTPHHHPAGAGDASSMRIVKMYDQLPMTFEPNVGQADPQIKFQSRSKAYTVSLTSPEAVFTLRPSRVRTTRPRVDGVQDAAALYANAAESSTVIRMAFLHANRPRAIEGLEPLSGKSNYFMGPDRSTWYTGISNYAKVRYASVYPGIDLVYHGNQEQLEYDFVVAPHADPSAIRMTFSGAQEIELNQDGDLVIRVDEVTLRQHRPIAYQELNGIRREVASEYIVDSEGVITFKLGQYDARSTLIIDPVLIYSTYVDEIGVDIAVDASGNAYVTTGWSIIKFDSAGAVVYSSKVGDPLVGGFGLTAVAADSLGNAYASGTTLDPSFPTTPGAFQRGCSLVPAEGKCSPAGVVVKVDPTGSQLLYSTYLGADVPWEEGGLHYGSYTLDVAIDESFNAVVVGATGPGFPVTAGAFQTVHAADRFRGGTFNGFVAKLNSSGSDLLYATYLGGRKEDVIRGVALDTSGSAYVTGDASSENFPTTLGAFQTTCPINGVLPRTCPIAFVSKLNNTGTSLVYSTFLGGTTPQQIGAYSSSGKIAADQSGYAFVTGSAGMDFPTTLGALKPSTGSRDAFVTKLNQDGSGLVYSTFLGGDVGMWGGYDRGQDIAVDSSGNAYVIGGTEAIDFPVVNAVQSASHGGGITEAFVAKLNSDGNALIFSTYLGGSGEDEGRGIAVGAEGSMYVTGLTRSADFPTKNPAYPDLVGIGDGGFVAKVAEPSCSDVTNDVDVFRFPAFPFILPTLRLQLVVIRSHASHAIDGPLAFVMDDLKNAVFIGSRLKTSCFSPLGDPFMTVPAGGDTVLSPNEWVWTRLWFVKTGSGPISYVSHVTSGIPTN